MSTTVSFWKRVGSVFRAGGSTINTLNGNGETAVIPATGPPADGDSARAGPAPPEPRARAALLPWLRRERGVPQLAEGQRRLIELMDAMQEHFERQDGRAGQLNGSVERVASMLEQSAEAQRRVGERIDAIARQVDAAFSHTVTLSESLCRLPETLQAEAEAVRAIAQQLEIAHEADTQLMHALQQFEHAVDALRASGTAQVETLRELHRAEQEQRAALTALVREQGRRFLVAMVVAGALGLGALVALVITLVVLLGP